MLPDYPRELQIQFDQRVPMRDGVTLSADIYMPVAGAPCPVILMRTPYMKAHINLDTVKYFVRHGYIYISLDVRGRGDSDGEFIPYFNEGRDGYDAIEWCASQPWSNGRVGTIGASYGGRSQWLTAVERPPHLNAMIVLVPPSDPFVETPTGTPSPMHLCWLHLTSGRTLQSMDVVEWEQVYQHLPLVSMDERLGRNILAWRREMQHTQLDDYWLPLCYQQRFEQIDVPVLHISGWYDDEQIGTPLNYIGMVTRGATAEVRAQQRLLMGPWGHATNADAKLGMVDFGPQAIIDLRGEQLRWYERYLKQLDVEVGAPVRIFVMGDNEWRDEQEWPLARTQWTPYYLHSQGRANSRFGDGSLSLQKPAEEVCDTYQYDPAHPVPFITDATSSQIGGPDDYSSLQRRDDVLVYSTEVLSEDIEVTGPVKVQLYAASSAPDTDFMAMLIDVWPNGFRQRLCDGMVRARFRNGMQHPELIEPGQIYHCTLDCWNISQVFKAGHRICVQITSSAFPKYDRNQNTGEPLGLSTTLVTAKQRIYHDSEHPSFIQLPLIPRT
ncbi:CocE/NonD family hydrolase [Dictyobacter arantiisoli]|uniref:X-Pro dipeptidyl-peptidase n=1 Tax=Dictyobacter arantiisoli TaxID=2014874 RepID=A0A5A5THA6_9CHLR|nr:CocE/NonD family hydrolase [Dictyobacter arantiisoli]GCF10961.1 X-Pro dipeptidyl-peptidase [Dictyobacter arantiisoli]